MSGALKLLLLRVLLFGIALFMFANGANPLEEIVGWSLVGLGWLTFIPAFSKFYKD